MKVTGAEIKAWRDQQGMTQKELAMMLGVGEKTISRWERSVSAITGTAGMILEVLIRKDMRKVEVLYSKLRKVYIETLI